MRVEKNEAGGPEKQTILFVWPKTKLCTLDYWVSVAISMLGHVLHVNSGNVLVHGDMNVSILLKPYPPNIHMYIVGEFKFN